MSLLGLLSFSGCGVEACMAASSGRTAICLGASRAQNCLTAGCKDSFSLIQTITWTPLTVHKLKTQAWLLSVDTCNILTHNSYSTFIELNCKIIENVESWKPAAYEWNSNNLRLKSLCFETSTNTLIPYWALELVTPSVDQVLWKEIASGWKLPGCSQLARRKTYWRSLRWHRASNCIFYLM